LLLGAVYKFAYLLTYLRAQSDPRTHHFHRSSLKVSEIEETRKVECAYHF